MIIFKSIAQKTILNDTWQSRSNGNNIFDLRPISTKIGTRKKKKKNSRKRKTQNVKIPCNMKEKLAIEEIDT